MSKRSIEKRKHRIVSRVLIVFLWLAVIAIALEVYTAFRIYWIERHNPLILSFCGEAVMPVHGFGPAPELDVDCITTHIGWVPWFAWQSAGEAARGQDGAGARSGVPTAPLWYFAKRHENREERAARRAVFPSLSEADRQLFAIIHNETIVVVHEGGAFDRVHGNTIFARAIQFFGSTARGKVLRWTVLRRTWTRFCEDVRQGAQVLEPRYRRVRCFMGDIADQVDTYFLRSVDGATGEKTGFAFIEMHEALLEHVAKSVPENSPWEVPYFEYRKNLHGSYSGLGMDLDTNNFGFRDDDVAVPKPEGVFRIVCIGGSTTEEGQRTDSSYPNRLERKLNAYFPAKKIEVINCGISGLSSPSHMARFPDYLALKPDLLVVYAGMNDMCHECLGMARMSLRLWKHALRRSRFVRLHWNAVLHPSDALVRQELASLPFADLRAMHRIAASRGIRMAMCSFAYPDSGCLVRTETDFFDYYTRTRCHDICLSFATYCRVMRLYNEEVRALCSSEHILYIPVAECLRAGLYCFRDVCHMHEEGIKRKTEIIFEALKEYIRPAVSSPL